MTTLRNKLIEAGFANHVLTDSDLESLLEGTPASRHGLVNKALGKAELVRLRRGLYLLADQYRHKKISKFFLASRVVPHSYVSLESALSYHDWIPEHVTTVTSVIGSGRTKIFKTPFGEFAYYYLPTNEYEFLTGVIRVEEVAEEPFFIASPLRALIDYVYFKKIHWRGLSYLTQGMRIEIEQLMEVDSNDFIAMQNIYHSKRVSHFLDKLKQELQK